MAEVDPFHFPWTVADVARVWRACRLGHELLEGDDRHLAISLEAHARHADLWEIADELGQQINWRLLFLLSGAMISKLVAEADPVVVSTCRALVDRGRTEEDALVEIHKAHVAITVALSVRGIRVPERRLYIWRTMLQGLAADTLGARADEMFEELARSFRVDLPH